MPDEEIIVRAAEAAGVAPRTVAEIERTPGILTRVLDAMVSTPFYPEGWTPGYPTSLSDTKAGYEDLIRRVVLQTAAEGGVVMVAHAAGIPLTGARGVLRAFVTASRETRIARLVRETEIGERAARKTVDESDRQRLEYLRRFYQVWKELPTHYDLVLNTDIFTVAAAAKLLVAAAKSI